MAIVGMSFPLWLLPAPTWDPLAYSAKKAFVIATRMNYTLYAIVLLSNTITRNPD